MSRSQAPATRHRWPASLDRAGASPIAETRELAVATLAAWHEAGRTAEARTALQAALAVETDDHVAGNMRRVLAGDPAVGRPYQAPWERRP